MKDKDYKIALIKKEIEDYSKIYDPKCKKVIELKNKLNKITK